MREGEGEEGEEGEGEKKSESKEKREKGVLLERHSISMTGKYQ